jgi:opacity protein-like surface antigen
MKTVVTVFVASLSFALTAAAADAPRFGAYVGYDWMQFNPDTANIPSFHANGGSGQFMYTFYKGLGAAFEAGVVSKDSVTRVFSNRQSHFLLGPRYGYYNHSRFTPFVEVLFGASRGSVSLDLNQVQEVFPSSSINLPNDVSGRLTASRTQFSMMAGGGLDIRLTEKVISWRLFDADYYLCRPNSLITAQDVNKNNFRVTTGINFNWGKR